MGVKISTKYPLSTWYNQSFPHNIEEQIFQILLQNYPAAQDDSYFSPSLNQLPSPDLLLNINDVIDRLIYIIRFSKKLLIVGDYDADGISSTVLLIRFFEKINFTNYVFFIPNRFIHGYGLNDHALAEIYQINPDFVITVDNGITAASQVAKLEQRGISVIITDHHEINNDCLPQCLIINPKQSDCAFPDKTLSGVGVVFFILIALRKALREQNYFQSISEPNLLENLDLVAIGSIADQVPLLETNRILVQFGLKEINKRLRETEVPPFFMYLKELQKKNAFTIINSETVGFQIAPLLNAAGRLQNANISVNFLLAKDPITAKDFYEKLYKINQQRKKIGDDMLQIAEKMIQQQNLKKEKGIVLFHNDFHEGVLGVVANKISDMYQKPTILFARSTKDTTLKGSSRTIKDVNILKLLESCEESLLYYGGHTGAAGCVVESDQLPFFQEKFLSKCNSLINFYQKPEINPDIEVQPWMLSNHLLKLLNYLEPFGAFNPKPLFLLKDLILPFPIIFAKKHLKWSLTPQIEMIYWNGKKNFTWQKKYNIACRITPNLRKKNDDLLLIVEAIIS